MRGVLFFVAAGSALVIACRLLGDIAAGGSAALTVPSQEYPLMKEYAVWPRRLRSRIRKRELFIGWV